MRSLFLAAIFLLSTSTAFANTKWTGWVYWSFQGSGVKCLSNLRVNETETTFHRMGGFFDCDLVTMEVNEQILSKVNNKLLLDGVEVGTYENNTYKWTERYSQEVTIQNTIKINATNMDYHEKWIQADGRDLYNIEGRFFRQ